MKRIKRDLEQIIAELEERRRREEVALQAFLAAQTQTIPCEFHPSVMRTISAELTAAEGRHPVDPWKPIYEPCSECRAIEREAFVQRHLRYCGVPEVLLPCSLENWTPENEKEAENLEKVKEFVKAKTGFLFLLGPVGCGKSHLAVGVMRCFHDSFDRYGEHVPKRLFIKQSTLLGRRRETYRDSSASNPIAECNDMRLLVLDDAGLSAGGRDELPMLHEILDYRYGRKLPTIVTSNLPWDELRHLFGERMADRLGQSSFAVLTFSGPSHRSQLRDQYFQK
jgi:DNA replication protein DnaC